MDLISEYYDSLKSVKILNKQEELIEYEKYIKGDKEAGDRLVESSLRLSFSIAKSYWKDNSPETLQELISSGNEGLLKALAKFDPEKGVKFSTYAAYWILMHVRKYVVEDSNLVKPSIKIRRSTKLSESAKRDFNSNIVYKEAKDYNCVSEDPTPEEVIESRDTDARQAIVLDCLLRFLTQRERLVVTQVYGIGSAEEKPESLCRLGETLGLSSERVRQIKESAQAKMVSWADYFA